MDNYPNALPLTRKVLRVLLVLNPLFGGFIAILLIASFLAGDWVAKALSEHAEPIGSKLITGMRLIMIMGIFAVPIAQLVLRRLAAIVETVRVGDPFVIVNAARLQTIAWAMLSLEVLHFIIGSVASAYSTDTHPLDIDRDFSVTRLLAVLLCFVLARVFEHGARMRDDLQGTV
jgi:hypothetical protein